MKASFQTSIISCNKKINSEKNVPVDFLAADGRVQSIMAQTAEPCFSSFLEWLKSFYLGKTVIRIRLTEQSPILYIKINDLKEVLNSEQIQDLKKGNVINFIEEQKQLRLKMERIGRKIEALADKKGMHLIFHQEYISNLFRNIGFKAFGITKKLIRDLEGKSENKIKPDKETKAKLEAKIKQLIFSLPSNMESSDSGCGVSNSQTTIKLKKKKNKSIESESNKLINFAKNLGFDKKDVKNLQRLGNKTSFHSLNKLLRNIESKEEKFVMIKTFVAIGQELTTKFSLFKEEVRYFKRVKRGGKRITHAFAINKKDIFIVPNKDCLGKGSLKKVSEAIKLNDLSTFFVRVKAKAMKGRSLQCTKTIGSVELERKLLEKLHRHGRSSRQLEHSCLMPPYECRVLSDQENSSSLIMFQKKLNDGKKLMGAPIIQIAHVLRDVAIGLTYLHSLKYVHMDVKPPNFLFEGDIKGSTPLKGKLSDFGLAAKKGAPIKGGSLAYLPGETICFSSGSKTLTFKSGSIADPKIDSFSLGVTIFHLVKGTLPKVFGLLKQRQINEIVKLEKTRIIESSDSKKEIKIKLQILDIALQLMQEKPDLRMSCQAAVEKLNSILS